MKLRIATYNIHKCKTGIAGRPRLHEVRMGLHAMDADIVFLQEVQDENQQIGKRFPYHPGGRQLDFLATTGYPWSAYGKNAVYEHGHHGNAILSRQPLVSWENLDISAHRFESRGMLHAVVTVPGRLPGTDGLVRPLRELHLLCVHLGLFSAGRNQQAQALVDRVRSSVPAEAPLVIAGDFNDWRSHLHAPLVHALGVTEVFAGTQQTRPARTFPSRLPWLRLDRIYVRGCHVRKAQVVSGSAWGQRSDHAPLLADIELD